MYMPVHFALQDEEARALLRCHPLGTLVTWSGEAFDANPVPFLFEELPDGSTRLRAHLARANGQWKSLVGGAPVLVVFMGLERYITPSWYATKRETGKVVPTWNYVTAHVHGICHAVEDPEWLHRQITDLTERHEADRAEPWAVTDAPKPFVEAQVRAIVGIEIAVTRIEAKAKLSQNRNEADRRGVAEGLAAEPDAAAVAMAKLIPR